MGIDKAGCGFLTIGVNNIRSSKKMLLAEITVYVSYKCDLRDQK